VDVLLRWSQSNVPLGLKDRCRKFMTLFVPSTHPKNSNVALCMQMANDKMTFRDCFIFLNYFGNGSWMFSSFKLWFVFLRHYFLGNWYNNGISMLWKQIGFNDTARFCRLVMNNRTTPTGFTLNHQYINSIDSHHNLHAFD